MSFQPQGRGPPTLTGGLLESETELHELSTKFVFVVLVSSTQGFVSLLLFQVFFAFSFHHVSFHQLGFFSAWFLPCWGRAEVVSARLHLRHGTHILGECIISSVLSRCSKDLKQRTSVTAQSFFRQTKDSIPSRHECRPCPKGRPQSWLPPFICLLPSLSLPYAQWASQEGACLLHLKFSLQPTDFLLFHFFSRLFSLSFSHHHFGLLFPILTI